MANRFTDSRKWYDGWFMSLDPAYKLMWIYILDLCNHAGIYKLNRKLEECCLGFPLDLDTEVFKERILSLGDDKYFIPKFIEFQYKVSLENLDPNNRVHLSVVNTLKSYKIKPLKSPLQGAKDKDKDKDKNKDTGGVGGKHAFTPPKEEVEQLKRNLSKTGKT